MRGILCCGGPGFVIKTVVCKQHRLVVLIKDKARNPQQWTLSKYWLLQLIVLATDNGHPLPVRGAIVPLVGKERTSLKTHKSIASLLLTSLCYVGLDFSPYEPTVLKESREVHEMRSPYSK